LFNVNQGSPISHFLCALTHQIGSLNAMAATATFCHFVALFQTDPKSLKWDGKLKNDVSNKAGPFLYRYRNNIQFRGE
jgi:hypothetical protein